MAEAVSESSFMEAYVETLAISIDLGDLNLFKTYMSNVDGDLGRFPDIFPSPSLSLINILGEPEVSISFTRVALEYPRFVTNVGLDYFEWVASSDLDRRRIFLEIMMKSSIVFQMIMAPLIRRYPDQGMRWVIAGWSDSGFMVLKLIQRMIFNRLIFTPEDQGKITRLAVDENYRHPGQGWAQVLTILPVIGSIQHHPVNLYEYNGRIDEILRRDDVEAFRALLEEKAYLLSVERGSYSVALSVASMITEPLRDPMVVAALTFPPFVVNLLADMIGPAPTDQIRGRIPFLAINVRSMVLFGAIMVVVLRQHPNEVLGWIMAPASGIVELALVRCLLAFEIPIPSSGLSDVVMRLVDIITDNLTRPPISTTLEQWGTSLQLLLTYPYKLA